MMEVRVDESQVTVTVPSFRSILFERLAAHGITHNVGEIVLEEITITTALYIHKLRKYERAALDAAKVAGKVIYLEPGAALQRSSPTNDAKPAKRELPPAVEL